MASNVEPVDGGSPVVGIAAGAGALVVAFLVARWVLGALWGAIQFGFYAAVVLAVIYVVARLSRGMKA